MLKLLRKLLGPIKPIVRKLYPSYFIYDTIPYWVKREGPTYYDNYSVNFDNTLQAKAQEVALISQLKKLDFATILEYGCGYGRILRLLELEFPQRKIEGYDVSPHQLANARKRLGDDTKCDLYLVNGRSIPKEDNSSDAVVVCNVLQHQTHDLIDVVRGELLRVARKYILLIEPNHSDEEEELDRKEGKQINKTCYKHNHTAYFSSRGCRILRYEWIPQAGNFIILFEKLS